MLQRIQTVYLLLITVLMVILLFLPLAVVQSGNQVFTFDVTGVRSIGEQSELVYPFWGLFALAAIIALLALVTVFLYKKRILQIRLCVFNAILMVCFYGLFLFLGYDLKGSLEPLSLSVRLALCIPLICLILDYLAIRNIGADEILVRSLDRLR